MSSFRDMVKIFRRDYADVLGVDVGTSGVKVVRMKRVSGIPTVMGVDILPAINLSDLQNPPEPIQLPKVLKAKYAALCVSGNGALFKLLTFPGHSDKSTEAHVNELMGLGENSDCRMGYELVSENRTEKRVLASAIPDGVARALCGLFPVAIPAPCSIEVSGLAALTAFSRGPGAQRPDDSFAVIDFGASNTLVAFFNKSQIVMVRKFDFGAANVLKKLQDNLGVDQETAIGILNDGSFDVSRVVHQAMESFLQQLTISWDFVERRENVHITGLYACGGGVYLRLWAQEIESTTGHKPLIWNPFEGLAVAAGAIPDRFKGVESRFVSALGASLAMLKVR